MSPLLGSPNGNILQNKYQDIHIDTIHLSFSDLFVFLGVCVLCSIEFYYMSTLISFKHKVVIASSMTFLTLCLEGKSCDYKTENCKVHVSFKFSRSWVKIEGLSVQSLKSKETYALSVSRIKCFTI